MNSHDSHGKYQYELKQEDKHIKFVTYWTKAIFRKTVKKDTSRMDAPAHELKHNRSNRTCKGCDTSVNNDFRDN